MVEAGMESSGIIGIMSDVHANKYALDKVVISTRPLTSRWWVLGDIVGYGPHPAETLRWMLHHAELWHAGNHEIAYCLWMCSNYIGTVKLNDSAAVMRQLSRVLLTHAKTDLDDALRREILDDAREHIRLDRVKPRVTHFPDLTAVTVHGTPAGDTWQAWVQDVYLRPEVRDTADGKNGHRHLLDALNALSTYRRANEQVIGFVGHSHVQFVAGLDEQGCVLLYPYEFGLPIDLRSLPQTVLVNVGSVGKPHDGDTRSGFVLFDPTQHTLTIQRMDYASHRTADDLRALDATTLLSRNDWDLLGLLPSLNRHNKLRENVQDEIDLLAGLLECGEKDKWCARHYGRFLRLGENGVTVTQAQAPCDQ